MKNFLRFILKSSFTAFLGLNVGTVLAQVPPSGLVSRWQGESNVLDTVGVNNGVVNAQIGYTNGIVGQAFRIAGGIIQTPHSASLAPSNITVQAWVRATAPGTFRYILSKSMSGGGVSYAIYTAGTGGAAFFVTLDNGAGTLLSPIATAAQVWDGNWHQLTGVFDGTTSRLFVDGAEVGSGTATAAAAGINYVNPQPLVFGDYQVARGLPYAGDIDEVKVFNSALSSTQIADTFTNLGSAAGAANLVSWYKAEGNTLDAQGANSATAVLNVFTYAPGKYNLGFFGKGGNAVVPDSASLKPANLTLQVWVKSVQPGAFRYIVGKSRSAGGISYAFYTGSGGGAAFFVGLEAGGGTLLSPTVSPQAVWDGAWHLLTGTYDGAFCRVYLDGVEIGAGTAAPGANTIDYSSPNSLVFADYQAAGGLSFTGQFDDVQLYDRALAAGEIKTYFANANLVSWWMAEADAVDFISANNGALVGGTTFIASRLRGKAFSTGPGTVEISDAASLQPTNVTLEALVSAFSPGANKVLISKSATVTASSYAFSTGPNGGLIFSVNLPAGVIASPAADPSIWNGEYHQIAGTYDGQFVRLYVDGKQIGNGTAGSGNIQYSASQNSGKLIFGNSSSGGPAAFVGAIDEVKLYQSALTGVEVDQNAFKQLLIVNHPVGGSFAAGTNVALAVTVQGASPFQYQYLLNGTNIPNATSRTFTITNLQSTSAGNYQVAISSGGLRYTNGIAGNSFDVGKGGLVRVLNNANFSSQLFSIQIWARATAPGTFKYLLSKSRDPAFYSSSYGFYTAADGGLTSSWSFRRPRACPARLGSCRFPSGPTSGTATGICSPERGTDNSFRFTLMAL